MAKTKRAKKINLYRYIMFFYHYERNHSHKPIWPKSNVKAVTGTCCRHWSDRRGRHQRESYYLTLAIIVPPRIIWSWYTDRWWVHGLLHLVQRGGDWAGLQPTHPFLAVPIVTAHPLTTTVPISVLPYCIMIRCSAVLMRPLKETVTARHDTPIQTPAESFCRIMAPLTFIAV